MIQMLFSSLWIKMVEEPTDQPIHANISVQATPGRTLAEAICEPSHEVANNAVSNCL